MNRIIFIISILWIFPLHTSADIRIGWIGPLTGNSAVTGTDALESIRLVINEINSSGGIHGHQIKLFAEDDRYEVSRTLNAYKKLVHQNNIQILIVSTYGGVFALANRVEKDNVVLIDPLDCNNEIAALSENIFCLATQTESIAKNFAEDILRQRSKSVLILHEEEGWMNFIVKNTVRFLSTYPEIQVWKEAVSPTDTDFRSLLIRAQKRNVSSIIFLGNDQMGNGLAQARNFGIEAQFYGIGSVSSPGFQKLAGSAIEGIRVSFWKAERTKAYENFVKAFEQQSGRKPYLELAAVPAYDVATLMIQALKSPGVFSDTIQIPEFKRFFLQVKNFPGLSGNISFDPDGAVRTIEETLFEF